MQLLNKEVKMTMKEEAYKHHLQGLSYKEIGDKLGLSKTTAYEYVKEVKLSNNIFFVPPVPNASELVPNVRSERKKEMNPHKEINTERNLKAIPKIKEFTGDDLVKKQFDSLYFEGKFLELIGRPSKHFHAVIWGLPKGGKSNFAIRFADYLQEYFGLVTYIASEEGESITLQEKFKAIGGSKATIVETRNRDVIREYLKTCKADFVFLDSINNADIDNEFLEKLKAENPSKSFVAIVQATKGGNFKGDQALTHNCDFIIKVIEGIAYHEGRFAPTSEVKIFEEPLYSKNTNKDIVEEKKSLQFDKAKLVPFDLEILNKNFVKFKPLFKPYEEIKPKPVIFKKTIPITQNKENPRDLLVALGGILLANWLLGSNKKDE